MDDGLSRAVRTIFKRLYDAGLIYQAERLVNWSPVLETAISDLEVKYEDVEGELVSFRYGSLRDDEPHIVVATTRVETMLGDTAIAVHPDDERYRDLVGTTLPHPFVDRETDHRRRRTRRPRVRHGRSQGHARPRSRTTSRSACATSCRCRRSWTPGAGSPTPEPNSTAWTASRRASRCARRWPSRAASSTRSGRTCTASGTPSAAASRSSRGCRCSGGSRSSRWPRPPATRCATATP